MGDQAVEDAEGNYFIDADPVYFGQVIKCLQVGRIMYERGIDYDNVEAEMQRWGVEWLEMQMKWHDEMETVQTRRSMRQHERDTVRNMLTKAKKKGCPESTETALKILNALHNFHFQQTVADELKEYM